ncbi:MarR family winged helix-turn-helix transcriptional regulator [Actinoplanes sp. L3-i22]|uniref:MarR family winged helix-turn-helix transcriptional regulator n=1 Tax=Actinoplanes sp. L3-i22 TaxID=2836373 RepID=UPI001C7535ED|nr:MarR family transcriptional regulator [Actinoplanes sp. L3-i22]BCY10462.1 MarR family transcriptional regulator [Actinoplanes sp. L3-i22]
MDPTDALVQLSFQIQRILTAVGAEHDLSIVQVRMLGILRDRTPGMLELGRHLGLDKSSITGLVSRAEKRELVRRLPSPDDGRAVLVELTPLGRRFTRECTAEVARRIAELTARLSEPDRARLTALAATLVAPFPDA